MNGKVTLGLLVVFMLLGLYIYFFELGSEEAAPSPQIFETQYSEFDIVAITVSNAEGQRAQYARNRDVPNQPWRTLEPIPLEPEAIDQVPINGAATVLGELTTNQTIPTPANLDQYGLAPPRLTITITISNSERITLYAGGEAPVGNSRYLQLADDESKTIYLAESYAINTLDRLLTQPPLAPTPLPTITPSRIP